eukprot:10743529-Lingulodinium_polyedra.AAC.1
MVELSTVVQCCTGLGCVEHQVHDDCSVDSSGVVRASRLEWNIQADGHWMVQRATVRRPSVGR